MISMTLFIGFMCAVTVAHGISVAEYSRALNDFFNQTNGKEWSKGSNWLTTVDPCLWDGIFCLQGKLFSLDLSNTSLSGVIAEETLLAFQTLRYSIFVHVGVHGM